ncbi:hypothetical protein O9992_22600 [Vibrio lentus]|nr:hypothetical protein [Vibrio lentus]
MSTTPCRTTPHDGRTQSQKVSVKAAQKQQSKSLISLSTIRMTSFANIFRSKCSSRFIIDHEQCDDAANRALLEEIHGLRFAGKRAAAFGSSGWTGGAVKRIDARLHEANFEVRQPAKHIHWKPDTDALRQCIDYGMTLAEVYV